MSEAGKNRITLRYVPAEDRLRLGCLDDSGVERVWWLTRRVTFALLGTLVRVEARLVANSGAEETSLLTPKQDLGRGPAGAGEDSREARVVTGIRHRLLEGGQRVLFNFSSQDGQALRFSLRASGVRQLQRRLHILSRRSGWLGDHAEIQARRPGQAPDTLLPPSKVPGKVLH